jgi:hypothetical protein
VGSQTGKTAGKEGDGGANGGKKRDKNGDEIDPKGATGAQGQVIMVEIP